MVRAAVPAGKRWLDVGCGTGALSSTILEIAKPISVAGIDPSQGYIQFARDSIQDARARFCVGDARALPYDRGIYGAAVLGLVLNFVPTPKRL